MRLLKKKKKTPTVLAVVGKMYLVVYYLGTLSDRTWNVKWKRALIFGTVFVFVLFFVTLSDAIYLLSGTLFI